MDFLSEEKINECSRFVKKTPCRADSIKLITCSFQEFLSGMIIMITWSPDLFITHFKDTVFTKNKCYWFNSAWLICLQSGSIHLFFSYLKSLVFSSRWYYYIFQFDGLQIFWIYLIFWWSWINGLFDVPHSMLLSSLKLLFD